MPADPLILDPAAQLIIIDGRSGSGKTELAARMASGRGATVVHMDDLYEGWGGLAAGQRYLIGTILAPLARNRPARWQQWNWQTGRRDIWHLIGTDQKLIIEGCGALTPQTRAEADLAIWLDAPESVRRTRARTRDGDDWWWEPWAEQEAEHLQRNRPEELADLVVVTG